MLRSILFLSLAALLRPAFSQSDVVYGYYESALTYGRQSINGSARMLGLGGAQNALGADMGTHAYNPAGIAFYRTSNVAFSSTLNLGNSTASFTDSDIFEKEDSRANFNFNNFGFVWSSVSDNPVEGPWKAFNIGVSRTRLDNYQYQYTYEGLASNSSYREYFTDLAYGIDAQNFDSQNEGDDRVDDLLGLAYWSFLLNANDDDPTTYWTFDPGVNSIQSETITSKGAKYQWDFTMGANYEDKIYIGAGLGHMSVRHLLTYSFLEAPQGDDTDINFFTLDENIEVRGSGQNFKLGIVAKPNDELRIGASVVTPTKLTLTETYFAEGYAEYNDAEFSPNFNLTEFAIRTHTNEFTYELRTPLRINTGAAYFIKKKGFISADVDVISYGSSQLDNDAGELAGDQAVVEDIYGTTINLRLGGEYRIEKFRLRAGFAQEGNPYKSEISNSFKGKTNYTLGAGYRDRANYVDLAGVWTNWSTGYSRYAYEDGSEPQITADWRNIGVVLSYGFTF